MKNTFKSDIMPFEMYKNLYFVGSNRVSVHIIKTECGLIMIDTGYPDMYEQILDSMLYLGLEPENICAIFHSHGHIDHFGCTMKFKELSGAKTYISRIDNDIVNGTYDLSWTKELGLERISPFDCDVLVEDGDSFKFGETTVSCILTPGHTAGVLSFFINVSGIVAGMHGGIGTNSMRCDFLNKYGLSFDCRDKFRDGLHKLKNEYVDIVLGNHPQQNNTLNKLQKVLNKSSVVDPTEWRRFLIYAEEKLDKLIKEELFSTKEK